VVSYEDLWLEPVNLEPLFASLGLPMSPLVQDRYNLLIGLSQDLESQRGNFLTSASRRYIALNAPFESYRALFSKRLLLDVIARQ
jgi:hypothetical protein